MERKPAIVIGGGAVGVDFHLPRLKNICGADEVYIVEPDSSRQKLLDGKLSGQGVIILPEVPDNTSCFSVAVIATPPKFHFDYVDLLADRCEKLVIEKPIARSFAEADRIVERLKKSHTIAYICHIRRTLQSFKLIRQLVETNIFGDLKSVHVHEGNVFNWRAASIGSFSRDLNGGGVLLDTGPHTLDLMLQVFDDLKVNRATVDADLLNSKKAIEANCHLDLVSNTGVPIRMVLSRNRNLSNKARFQFDKVLIVVDLRDNTLNLEFGDTCSMLATPDMAEGKPMRFADLFDTFYCKYIQTGDNQGVSPQEALPIMRIIDEAYAKASKIEAGF